MAAETCADCTTTYAVGVEQCPQCGSTERVEQPAGRAVLPSVTVTCANTGCRYESRERRVHLRTAAQGVLELPRLVCAGCGYDMPTVTPWPPVTDPEEEQMPKITVHGGPSIDGHVVDPETSEVTPVEAEEGEDVSAGSSSSTSSETESSSPETSEQSPPSPARTAASRSKKVATDKGSSAPSTGGDQAAGTSANDK
ncbi:hypothetical protein ACFYRN_19140 [Streptomyces sp. NPDC005227]|uniref:hypothetical protein n=1 Tax=Streptomyces sp. NPDC005227 TaxID=3364707 RepID=UPI0036873848